MLRNTVLYRRFWYMRRRNARQISIYIKLISIIIIFALLVSYSAKKMLPYIIESSGSRVKDIVESTVNDAAFDSLEGGAEYSRLVTVVRDDKNILSVHMDRAEAGRLSAEISEKIENKLSVLEDDHITVPLGILLGGTGFARIGPGLHIKVKPSGGVKVELKSEFVGIDDSRTIHRIILQIKTCMGVNIPLMMGSFELTTAVTVAERIIIGIMPGK